MNDSLRETLKQRFKTAIDKREQENAFSGTVWVSHGSAPVFTGAWGYACRPCRTPNTVETLFTTASVTKIFTATAILQLVESGRLALDQSVGTLLPLPQTTISSEVTVRHLLTHTSGIGDYFPEDEESWPRVFQTIPTYTLRRVADFLPLFTDLPSRFAPGTRFGYCNAGYILLGRLIEVLTGEDYFEVIRQRIFVPAGMERACFPTVDTVCDQLAEAYVAANVGGATHWRKCISTHIPPAPDGGLAASALELDRYWHALLSGRLLGAQLLQMMLTPHVTIREGRAYGLGVYLVSDAHGVTRYEAHGFDLGVNAYIAHYPTLELNAIVLSNLDKAATSVFNELHELLVEHAGR